MEKNSKKITYGSRHFESCIEARPLTCDLTKFQACGHVMLVVFRNGGFIVEPQDNFKTVFDCVGYTLKSNSKLIFRAIQTGLGTTSDSQDLIVNSPLYELFGFRELT